MNVWSLVLSIIAICIFIFVIIYSAKTKGRENFFLLGICFLIPAILLLITFLFAYFPQDRITLPLKIIIIGSVAFSLFCSISYFLEYFKRKRKKQNL